MNSYIFTESGISLMIDNKPYSIDNTNVNYDNVIQCIKDGTMDDIPGLINRIIPVVPYVAGQLEVDADAGTISFNGRQLDATLTTRLLGMMTAGIPVDPLVAFLNNVFLNPIPRVIDELYRFLEYGSLPITEDGHFIAYKRVNEDYTSVHDNVTDNSIGKTVSMDRDAVDSDSNQTCSTGLHFCSHEYLKNFTGDKVVILKVNPKDVVSIPTDYNNTKGRACSYEVIGELSPEEVEKALADSVLPVYVYWEEMDESDDDTDPDYDEDYDEDQETDRFDNFISDVAEDLGAYDQGYKDGKNKAPQPGTSDSDLYVQGYKDGRGHNRRAYPKP